MTAPTREQMNQWALDCGLIDQRDVDNGIVGALFDDLQRFSGIDLRRFAIQAYTEGMVAQAKRQPSPPIMVDLRSIDPEMMSKLLEKGKNFFGELKVMPDITATAVAAEREACAKVLDQMAEEAEQDCESSSLVAYYREKAAEIRARGQA